MRFTDEEHLYSYIAELMMEDNIDFVACPIISPWHAIGVDALVYDILQRKKDKPSGVVVITPHLRGRFTISEGDFACRDFARVRFYYLDSGSPTKELTISRQIDLAKKAFDILVAIRELRKEHKGDKAEIHIVTALFPNVFILRAFRSKELACKYYPIFSLIDEGIGTYMPEKIWRIGSKLINQEKEPKYFQVTRFLRVKLMHNAASVLKIVGGKCLAIEKRFLLEKSHSKFIRSRRLIESYRNIVEKRGALYKRQEMNRPMAMIITTVLHSRSAEASRMAESNLTSAVIDILIEAGFSVMIKPHPAEPVNKYDYISTKFQSGQVKLAAQEVLAEILFCALRPDCVIGHDSTSLINANILYDIPAIRITNILFSQEDSQVIDVGGKPFKRLVKEFSHDAGNFEKLRQILKSIASGGAVNTTTGGGRVE